MNDSGMVIVVFGPIIALGIYWQIRQSAFKRRIRSGAVDLFYVGGYPTLRNARTVLLENNGDTISVGDKVLAKDAIISVRLDEREVVISFDEGGIRYDMRFNGLNVDNKAARIREWVYRPAQNSPTA